MNGIKEMKFVPIDSVKPYELNPRKVLWGGGRRIIRKHKEIRLAKADTHR